MYDIDFENIDINRLRSDLEDEFGTAAFSGFPVAMMDVFNVQEASDEEIVKKALEMNYDLNDYAKDRYVR